MFWRFFKIWESERNFGDIPDASLLAVSVTLPWEEWSEIPTFLQKWQMYVYCHFNLGHNDKSITLRPLACIFTYDVWSVKFCVLYKLYIQRMLIAGASFGANQSMNNAFHTSRQAFASDDCTVRCGQEKTIPHLTLAGASSPRNCPA